MRKTDYTRVKESSHESHELAYTDILIKVTLHLVQLLDEEIR